MLFELRKTIKYVLTSLFLMPQLSSRKISPRSSSSSSVGHRLSLCLLAFLLLLPPFLCPLPNASWPLHVVVVPSQVAAVDICVCCGLGRHMLHTGKVIRPVRILNEYGCVPPLASLSVVSALEALFRHQEQDLVPLLAE
jgi:hypothetical protein